MKRIYVILISIFLLIDCSTIKPVDSMDPDYGDIEGNFYESKLGKFVCYVPVDARYAVMDDGNYKVSFYQKGIGLFKIQAIKNTPEIQQNLQKDSKEKVLKDFVETNLISKLANTRPGTKISFSNFIPDFRGGTYFFQIRVPSGSENKSEEGLPYQAYAMLAFTSGNFIYLITRDAEPFDESSSLLEKQKILQSSQKKLIEFHSRILILGDEKAGDLDLDAFDPQVDGEEEEEEELGGGGGGMGGSIDLGGILKILQRRLSVPRGRFDIKPGRFKWNSKRFNSNKFKMSGRTSIKPGRFKMKSSFKSHRFRR